MSDPIHHNKCVGVAKNFFTTALIANIDKPEFKASLPQYPYMFSKPLSCIQDPSKRHEFKIGPNNGPEDINFEVELGVMIGKPIEAYAEITKENLNDYIGGYFLLLDYTDKKFLVHDLTNSGPFFMGKCQDDLLVLSDFIEKERIPDCHNVWLELEIGGQVR